MTLNLRLAWVFGEDNVGDKFLRHHSSFSPSKCSKRSGLILCKTIQIISSMLKTGPKLNLSIVEAHGYSTNAFANDSSIIGLLHQGKADFSPPFMSVTARRHRLVRFSPLVGREPLLVVYSTPPLPRVRMDVGLMFPPAFAGIVLLSVVWRWLSRELFWQTAFSSLAVRLVLDLESTILTRSFDEPLRPLRPFRKNGDILERVREGRFRLMYVSHIIEKTMRAGEKALPKPPIHISTKKAAVASFHRLDSVSDPLVYVEDENKYLSRLCGVETFLDHSFAVTNHHVAFRPGFRRLLRRLTSRHGSVGRGIGRRLSVRLRPFHSDCPVTLPPDGRLLLAQCEAVFAALAVALSLAAAVAGAEVAWRTSRRATLIIALLSC